jgi:hypothetical membrane protein
LTGVLGPACFLLAVTVCGMLRPAYSHATQMISELGETGGQYSALMNYGGFIPTGLLVIAFAVVLFRSYPRSRSSAIGSVLVGAFGGGVLAAGVFSCDMGCPPQPGSLEGELHNFVSLIAFAGGIGGTFAWARHFRTVAARPGLAQYSTWSGVIAVWFLVATFVSIQSRAWTGVWQRIFLGVLFLWCVVVAIRTARPPRSPAVA